MSAQPTPPSAPAQPEPTPSADAAAPPPDAAAAAAAAEVPLNRAARRAKVKQAGPTHVGPREERTNQSRGPRSHSKRPKS